MSFLRIPARVRVLRPSRMMVAGAFYAFFLLIGIAMPTAYIVQSPGPVLDVTGEVSGEDVLTVSGVETHDSATDLLMTTVTATGTADHGAPGIVAIGGVLSSDLQVVPVRSLYPKELSSADVRERNLTLMDFSQDTAAAVAFELAGMDVGMTLTIAGVPEDSSATGQLAEGDVLLAISSPSYRNEAGVTAGDDAGVGDAGAAGDSVASAAGEGNGAEDSGVPGDPVLPAADLLPTVGEDGFVQIDTFMDLSAVMDRTEPGTDVQLRVSRDGEEHVATVTASAPPPDITGWVASGSMLGVLVQVTDVELPANVEYAVDGIGGPSAGAVFTLAIYDSVTEGSLGESATIAGTGAVSWDGDIQPIGGIRHKLNGARGAGATDFIAPAVNCPETVGYEPDGLNVWAVRHIGEAIDAVEAIGTGDTSNLTPCSAITLAEPE